MSALLTKRVKHDLSNLFRGGQKPYFCLLKQKLSISNVCEHIRTMGEHDEQLMSVIRCGGDDVDAVLMGFSQAIVPHSALQTVDSLCKSVS